MFDEPICADDENRSIRFESMCAISPDCSKIAVDNGQSILLIDLFSGVILWKTLIKESRDDCRPSMTCSSSSIHYHLGGIFYLIDIPTGRVINRTELPFRTTLHEYGSDYSRRNQQFVFTCRGEAHFWDATTLSPLFTISQLSPTFPWARSDPEIAALMPGGVETSRWDVLGPNPSSQAEENWLRDQSPPEFQWAGYSNVSSRDSMDVESDGFYRFRGEIVKRKSKHLLVWQPQQHQPSRSVQIRSPATGELLEELFFAEGETVCRVKQVSDENGDGSEYFLFVLTTARKLHVFASCIDRMEEVENMTGVHSPYEAYSTIALREIVKYRQLNSQKSFNDTAEASKFKEFASARRSFERRLARRCVPLHLLQSFILPETISPRICKVFISNQRVVITTRTMETIALAFSFNPSVFRKMSRAVNLILNELADRSNYQVKNKITNANDTKTTTTTTIINPSDNKKTTIPFLPIDNNTTSTQPTPSTQVHPNPRRLTNSGSSTVASSAVSSCRSSFAPPLRTITNSSMSISRNTPEPSSAPVLPPRPVAPLRPIYHAAAAGSTRSSVNNTAVLAAGRDAVHRLNAKRVSNTPLLPPLRNSLSNIGKAPSVGFNPGNYHSSLPSSSSCTPASTSTRAATSLFPGQGTYRELKILKQRSTVELLGWLSEVPSQCTLLRLYSASELDKSVYYADITDNTFFTTWMSCRRRAPTLALDPNNNNNANHAPAVTWYLTKSDFKMFEMAPIDDSFLNSFKVLPDMAPRAHRTTEAVIRASLDFLANWKTFKATVADLEAQFVRLSEMKDHYLKAKMLENDMLLNVEQEQTTPFDAQLQAVIINHCELRMPTPPILVDRKHAVRYPINGRLPPFLLDKVFRINNRADAWSIVDWVSVKIERNNLRVYFFADENDIRQLQSGLPVVRDNGSDEEKLKMVREDDEEEAEEKRKMRALIEATFILTRS